MNFTSPSDFQYVTGANIDAQHPYGDLNRIEVDNNIMPLRTGDTKNRLRGMDIAFLQESANERERCIIDDDVTPTFTSSLEKNTISGVVDDLKAIAQLGQVAYDGTYTAAKRGFMKSVPIGSGDVTLLWDPPHQTSTYPSWDYSYPRGLLKALYVKNDDIKFSITDSELKAGQIETIFDFVKLLRFFSLDPDFFNPGRFLLGDYTITGNMPEHQEETLGKNWHRRAKQVNPYDPSLEFYYTATCHSFFRNPGGDDSFIDIENQFSKRIICFLYLFYNYNHLDEHDHRIQLYCFNMPSISQFGSFVNQKIITPFLKLYGRDFSKLTEYGSLYEETIEFSPFFVYELRDRTRWDI